MVNVQLSTVVAEGKQKFSAYSPEWIVGEVQFFDTGRKMLAENQKAVLTGWKDGSFSVWVKERSKQPPTFCLSMTKTSYSVVCDFCVCYMML